MQTAIHLDTNCLIRFAGGTSKKLSAAVLGWINQGVSVEVSAMAWAEFRCGPLSDDDCILVSEILTGVIPIDREISDEAARLFNATGRRSRSLADCLIAATALRSNAQLATENREDFQPFLAHGLQLA
jgi:predicted nucleic acid-binding protein